MTEASRTMILLVEDEAPMAASLAGELSSLGFDAAVARDGEAAVALFAGERGIDLVLMDFCLGGGIDGSVAAARIQRIRPVPVVFLIQRDEPTAAERIRDVARHGIVVKGSGELALRSSIETALELFAAEEALKRGSGELRASERRFRAIVENSHDAITLVSAEGKVLYESSNVPRITGNAISDRIGRSGFETVHPEDLHLIREAYAKVLANRGTVVRNFRFRAVKADGKVWWAEASATNLLDDPAVGAIVINYRDVGDRKRAEDIVKAQRDLAIALNEAEDQNRAFERVLDAALGLGGVDCGGIYLADEGSGRFVRVVSRGVSESFAAAVSAFSIDSIQDLIRRSGGAFYSKTEDLEPGITPRAAREEGLKALTALPIFHQGRLIALLTLASHVEEEILPDLRSAFETIAMQVGGALARIRSDAALRESEERHRILLDEAADPIYSVTRDGRFLYANKAFEQCVDNPLESLLGKNVRDVFAPDVAERRLAAIEEAFAAGTTTVAKNLVRREEGDRHYLTAITPIKGDDGTPRMAICSSKDITDLVAVEGALRGAVEERDTLFRELRHRIKNNLAMIESLIVLGQSQVDDPGTKGALEDLRGRIHPLVGLYERLDPGMDSRAIALDMYLSDIANAVIAASNGRVGLELDIEAMRVDARDAANLGLMLNELVTNALKHAYPGESRGTIRVRLTREGDGLLLEVRDDGSPLPPGFDPAASRGLGLLICRMLAGQSEGKLAIAAGEKLFSVSVRRLHSV
jgi:PAS domain S-box-containing protein